MEVTVIHTLKPFINSVNQKLNRLLLLALAAGLLSPIAAKAESLFTELEPVNPYSYKKSSLVKYWDEGKRYVDFVGTTFYKPCFNQQCNKHFINNLHKDFVLGQMNIRWKYSLDCMENKFNREKDNLGWFPVWVDQTALGVAEKYCPLDSWNQLPIDPTK